MMYEPATLSEYIGNERIKKIVRITIDACKKQKCQCPHILLVGRAGMGKTTLAKIISNELGLKCGIYTGKAINNIQILNGLMSIKLPPVLIIDEIHGVRPVLTDMLHQAMDHFQYSYVDEDNIPVTIETEPFTLIATTTEEGSLTGPFRSRCRILRLKPYSVGDLQTIIMNAATNMNIEIDNESAFEIAERSQNTARRAIKNFEKAYDYALNYNNGFIDHKTVCDMFTLYDVDKYGLTDEQRQIIMSLDSKGVGVDNIAQRLGMSKNTILNEYEPYLVQINFIERTTCGRILTNLGKKYKESLRV